MSTVTRQKPSKVRAKRAIRLPDRDDEEKRIVLRGVGWEIYDLLTDAVGEGSHVRMAYDGKDLEIMTTSSIHDFFKRLAGRFVDEITMAFAIPMTGSGQTTWKRPELTRGLEADDSFYFRADKISAVAAARRRRSMDIADYPNPDLAFEVDISPPAVDREDIYRKMQVAEIWCFDGKEVTIQGLGADGTYFVAQRSQFLPVTAAEIRRWLVEEDAGDETAWCGRLRAWCRRIARTRKAPAQPRRRKSGGK